MKYYKQIYRDGGEICGLAALYKTPENSDYYYFVEISKEEYFEFVDSGILRKNNL